MSNIDQFTTAGPDAYLEVVALADDLTALMGDDWEGRDLTYPASVAIETLARC